MVTLPCREGIILGFGTGGIWCRLFHNTHDWFLPSRNSINPPRPGASVELGAVNEPGFRWGPQSAWESSHQRLFLCSSSAAWSRLTIRLGICRSPCCTLSLVVSLGGPVRLSISSEQVFNLQKNIVVLGIGLVFLVF